MTTRPLVSPDGTIHWRRTIVFLSNFRRCPVFGAPISFNLRVFILSLDSSVEVDDLQIEIAIANKIVRLECLDAQCCVLGDMRVPR